MADGPAAEPQNTRTLPLRRIETFVAESTRENSCLVVDPVSDEVVSKSVDRRDEHPLWHAVHVAVNMAADSQRESGSSRYLLTGLDVYVVREPCLMCEMMLLHARIGRLFFVTPTDEGAIRKLAINDLKDTNHRYVAFHIDADAHPPTNVSNYPVIIGE